MSDWSTDLWSGLRPDPDCQNLVRALHKVQLLIDGLLISTLTRALMPSQRVQACKHKLNSSVKLLAEWNVCRQLDICYSAVSKTPAVDPCSDRIPAEEPVTARCVGSREGCSREQLLWAPKHGGSKLRSQAGLHQSSLAGSWSQLRGNGRHTSHMVRIGWQSKLNLALGCPQCHLSSAHCSAGPARPSAAAGGCPGYQAALPCPAETP